MDARGGHRGTSPTIGFLWDQRIALFDVGPVVPQDGLLDGRASLFDQHDVAGLLEAEAELVERVVLAFDAWAAFAAGNTERCGSAQAR